MPERLPLSRRKEAYLRGLARKSVRDRRRRFLAEGTRVVEEALRGRLRVAEIVATPSAAADIERWRSAGRLEGVVVTLTDARTFREIAESVHPQGVLAVVEEPSDGLDDLGVEGPMLLLDRLQDPGNVGTLLRTLQAVGGRSAVALTGTADVFSPKAVRASAGSVFHLTIAARVEPAAAVAWLAARGVPLLALDRSGDSLLDAAWIAPPSAAVAVGNEGAGVDSLLLERAATVLALPMAGGVDSLNAGVAGSVALYEWARRRGGLPTARPARVGPLSACRP